VTGKKVSWLLVYLPGHLDPAFGVFSGDSKKHFDEHGIVYNNTMGTSKNQVFSLTEK